MSAKKLFILENSLGHKVRTLAVDSSTFHLVYIKHERRIEAISSLEVLEQNEIAFEVIRKVNSKDISEKGLALPYLGRIRSFDPAALTSPSIQLPQDEDQERLQVYLKKTALAHAAFALLLIAGSLLASYFIQKKEEAPLVTIVIPPRETLTTTKTPTVKMSEKKIKPSQKIYKPRVAQKSLRTKPYKTLKSQAIQVEQVGALAALGGIPKGEKGYEGLDPQSLKAIRAAGSGNGGGGIGSTGRGGMKGYLPGSGLIAGSAGTGARAQGAGGYGTQGSGGGKAGYGKIAIVGGTSAVSLPLDDEATVEGGLDRDQIIAVINKNRGQIVYCYEKGLQSQPQLGGRVAVSFIIGPNGRVKAAQVADSSLASNNVENCILARMKTWQFPHPVGRVNVDVLYPFELMRVSSR